MSINSFYAMQGRLRRTFNRMLPSFTIDYRLSKLVRGRAALRATRELDWKVRHFLQSYELTIGRRDG